MDYENTLNLPKTNFPMKANLPQKEPGLLEFWDKIDLFGEICKKNKNNEKFILHDGPPYANGDIHMGTALNKILKDIIVKYKNMMGYYSPYVPGWDTHGLPTEHEVLKKAEGKISRSNIVEWRKRCYEFANHFIEVQKKQFKRLGVIGDWNNPYLTLSFLFEAEEIRVFWQIYNKGLIYRDLKPIYWCPNCMTALADAEIEYKDHLTSSIYVKFKVLNSKGLFQEDVHFLIWTTTPWTLPANVAIAVHPDVKYLLVETDKGELIIAEELLNNVVQETGLKVNKIEPKNSFKGFELESVVCQHPFIERQSIVILADFVKMDQGTGCVHIAPGHGIEDFEVGKKYNLPIISPLNDNGVFTEDVDLFKGEYCESANSKINMHLKDLGALIHESSINHQYPHCWRCKQPIIFRATKQWFMNVEKIRKEALDFIEKVNWIPSWGKERIREMVKLRPDWCLSRQRTWGVPIPVFYCCSCQSPVINEKTISKIITLVKEYGSNIWFEKDPDFLLPDNYKCPYCNNNEFSKEKDILDVWFDSGSSWASVLKDNEQLSFPADLYLEGSDQHRGWFQSSLLVCVASLGLAPFKSVLTHGFVVDEEGKKMSKSAGNVINPQEIIEKFGADVLRLWTASTDFRSDLSLSRNILNQNIDNYRKIRNTLRFLIGNLYDFSIEKDEIKYENMQEIDVWAINKLYLTLKEINNNFEEYKFHNAVKVILQYCINDLSGFYLDVLKDRLYTFKKDSKERKSAQTVMYHILLSLVKVLAPILSFTAEELWKEMKSLCHSGKFVEESVFLLNWFDSSKLPPVDNNIIQKWEKLINIRKEVLKALEIKRKNEIISSSLSSEIKIFANEEKLEFLKSFNEDLKSIFIVSKVELLPMVDKVPEDSYFSEDLGIVILVSKSMNKKCKRCWQHSESVGKDERFPDICERCIKVIV